MENREFSLEAPKRIVPDARRRGEALLDEGGSGDVDILGEAAYYICPSKEDRGKALALAKGGSG